MKILYGRGDYNEISQNPGITKKGGLKQSCYSSPTLKDVGSVPNTATSSKILILHSGDWILMAASDLCPQERGKDLQTLWGAPANCSFLGPVWKRPSTPAGWTNESAAWMRWENRPIRGLARCHYNDQTSRDGGRTDFGHVWDTSHQG